MRPLSGSQDRERFDGHADGEDGQERRHAHPQSAMERALPAALGWADKLEGDQETDDEKRTPGAESDPPPGDG